MSWWVSLVDPETKEIVEVPRFQEGGSQVLGGTTVGDLNVTYNYRKHYDFKDLNGQVAGDMIEDLEIDVQKLGVVRTNDYWDPTPGNVGFALSILLAWARRHPTAVFEVH